MQDKKILIITHELTRTGAPIVLLDMIRIFYRHGYQMEVITLSDGELRTELDKMHIPVMVQEHFINQAYEFFQYAGKFDLVVANTLITFEAVHLLQHMQVPVLWWLHEGRPYFEYFASVLPDFRNLPSNIHVFSVGHSVRDVIEELYGVRTELLHFGVQDLVPHKNERNMERKIDGRNGKISFLTAGTYAKVKGQDVLIDAIRSLPEKYFSRAEFFFCGSEKMYDEAVFLPVRQLSEEYENVTLLHELSRQEALAWMERCDCVIVPSRFESFSAVAVEMMMKGNLCLCTEACGVAHYVQDGVNGFTVPSEDAGALAEKMKYIIEQNERLADVREAGRRTYEAYFSMEAFERRMIELAGCLMNAGKDREKE